MLKLIRMGLKLKVFYNTSVQILGKGFSSLVALIVTGLITRYLGVKGYGDFTKVITYVPLFYMVADFGLNAIFIRQTKEESLKEDFLTLFNLRIVWALVLIFVSVAVLPFLPFDPAKDSGFSQAVKFSIIIGSITILTRAIYTSLNAYFQKILRYDYSVLANVFGNIFGLFLVYVFIFSQKPFFNFAKNGLVLTIIAYVFADLLMVFIVCFFGKKILEQITLSFDFKKMKTLFISSIPLGITLVFNLIYFRADTLILTAYRSSQEVGLYGLAYKFFETVLVIPTFYMNSVYPLIIQRMNVSGQSLKAFIAKNLKILALSSIVATIILYALSGLLIELVSGKEFANAVVPLRILSLGLPFFFLSSLYMWVLIALKKQLLLSVIYGTLMILNIVFNLLFIPLYGFYAASIITGISEFFVLLLTGFFSYKYLYEKND